MRKLFCLLCFLFPIMVQAQYHNSFTFSSDGHTGAFRSGNKIILFSLPDFRVSRTIDAAFYFSSFNRNLPDHYYNQDQEVFFRSMELSGSGEHLLFLSGGVFYRLSLSDSFAQLKKFSQDHSFSIQSIFSFRCDYSGENIVVLENGNSDQPVQCSPAYRLPVYVPISGRLFALHEVKMCNHTTVCDMDEMGNVVYQDPGGVYYYDKSTQQTEKIFSGETRIFSGSFSNGGQSLLLNIRQPLSDSLMSARKNCIDRELMQLLQINISEEEFMQMPDSLRAKEWPQYQKHFSWLNLCYQHEPWTLAISEREKGKWNDPVPVLPPHLNPVAWSCAISPDARKIMWIDLERDKDGNTITAKNLYLISRKENGKWSQKQIIMQVEDHNAPIYLFNDFAVFSDSGKHMLIGDLTQKNVRVREFSL